MTREAHASQIYLSYAAWADNQGLRGTANFLFRHVQEERNHLMKILEARNRKKLTHHWHHYRGLVTHTLAPDGSLSLRAAALDPVLVPPL
jgi:rubrerythrin